MSDNQLIFNSIYQNNKWGEGSGYGSTPEYTEAYRDFLQGYLKANNIKSVLDIGCGDWQFSKLIDWTGIDYLGVDVASDIIDINNETYSSLGKISFAQLDITKDDIPEVDLVIIKDCLQHLSNSSVYDALIKLKECKRVLITQDIMYGTPTYDCENGGYRYLDLRLRPFTLPLKEVFRFDDNVKSTMEWLPREMNEDMEKIIDLLKEEDGYTVRYGPNHDGGYVTPDLKFDKVITVGVGGCIRFEEDYAKKNPKTSFKFYDHTVAGLPAKISNSEFYKIGIGLNPNGTIPLNAVVRHSKIKDEVVLLKIDCEGAEWACGFEFTDLSKISAIILEIHDLGDERFSEVQYKVLEKLYDEFRCINIHPNNYGGVSLCGGRKVPKVLELSFIRKDIIQETTNTPLNYPNNPHAPELDFYQS